MKKTVFTLCAMLILSSFSGLMAQEGISPEEMQKAWDNAVTPGEQQEWLSQMAGDWVYTQSTWTEPGKDPVVSQGKAQNTMLLGGRYLRETYSGTNMGMPFQGENTLSHNNIDGKWYMSWIDNMGTGVMSGSGVREGNTITLDCPYPKMFGEGLDHFRIVQHIQSKDKHTMTMYMLGDDGSETKWMEVVFTRK
jgi:hypothetical protein